MVDQKKQPLHQQQHQQHQQQQQQQQQQEEDKEINLPEACWMQILCQLNVRDVCMAGRVNR